MPALPGLLKSIQSKEIFSPFLIPFFAIFWGYVFLGEKISINIIIGLSFILTGTFIGQQTTSARNN